MKAKITGYLESINYTGRNNWSVITIETTEIETIKVTDGNRDTKREQQCIKIKCTGILTQDKRDIGSLLELKGNYKYNEKYRCKQLEFSSVSVLKDSSQRGIVKFLEKELPNVGPMLARQMYEKFGDDTLNTIENNPQKIADNIKGLSIENAKQITSTYKKVKEDSVLKRYLYSIDLTSYQINRILEFFESSIDETKSLMEELKTGKIYNITEMHGIGFRKADIIAEKIGVNKTSGIRIRECILYTIKEIQNNEGHTGIDYNEIVKKTKGLLNIDKTFIDKQIEKLIEEEKITTFKKFIDSINNVNTVNNDKQNKDSQ